MLNFLLRRILAGLATLFVALFLMFVLVDAAIDPLQDLRESTAPNKAQLIAARIDLLNLDTNVVVRFFMWLMPTPKMPTARHEDGPIHSTSIGKAGAAPKRPRITLSKGTI